jgi:hypothetical protein
LKVQRIGQRRDQQTQQQTAMPFIIMQQVMPGIIIEFMQSQQAWIIFSQFLSPDVQVIMQPMSIISILHMPIMPMLHMQQHMPFIIMQQETIPPAIMLQRFCIIMAAVLSSHMHVIFIPPAHFSIFMVQRGIIMPGMLAGSEAIIPMRPIIGIPIMLPAIPAMPMLDIRSLLIVLIIASVVNPGRPWPVIVPNPMPPAPYGWLSTSATLSTAQNQRQGKPAICLADHAPIEKLTPLLTLS